MCGTCLPRLSAFKRFSNTIKKNKSYMREAVACLRYFQGDLMTRPDCEFLAWLSQSDLGLLPPATSPYTRPPPLSEQALPGDATVSHRTSLCCLRTLRLSAHHIHKGSCDPRSSQRKCTRRTPLPHSCRVLWLCVCVCVWCTFAWAAVAQVDRWPC